MVLHHPNPNKDLGYNFCLVDIWPLLGNRKAIMEKSINALICLGTSIINPLLFTLVVYYDIPTLFRESTYLLS